MKKLPDKFRWMPGMKVMRVKDSLIESRNRVSQETPRSSFWLADGWRPDLTDPATIGCLLGLVREAWGDPHLCVVYDSEDDVWHVCRWEAEGISMRGHGPTEGEALMAALERASDRREPVTPELVQQVAEESVRLGQEHAERTARNRRKS